MSRSSRRCIGTMGVIPLSAMLFIDWRCLKRTIARARLNTTRSQDDICIAGRLGPRSRAREPSNFHTLVNNGDTICAASEESVSLTISLAPSSTKPGWLGINLRYSLHPNFVPSMATDDEWKLWIEKYNIPICPHRTLAQLSDKLLDLFSHRHHAYSFSCNLCSTMLHVIPLRGPAAFILPYLEFEIERSISSHTRPNDPEWINTVSPWTDPCAEYGPGWQECDLLRSIGGGVMTRDDARVHTVLR